ncbi:MAG TPA: hypothetical protein VN824_20625 [Puia sp.]|nr:hypothetical protein [Puia sp.]
MLFRKIATILLLSFLFFNWVGYWLFISWFENHVESTLELKLDNDQYDASQLVHVKISAGRLPYSNSSAGFERADGQVDIGPIHYRYVGKRLYNDSVEFLCLPDRETSRLRTARDDFFSLVNDLQNTGHTKAPGSSGKTGVNILKVCYLEDHYLAVSCFPGDTVRPMAYRTSPLPTGYSLLRKLPPRREGIV